MVKKLIYFGIFTVMLQSCNVNKEPTFIKIDALKVLKLTKDTVHVTAEAYFENPNIVGGTISTDKIKVFTNDIEVAQVSSKAFKVPAKKEFIVPLSIKIPAKNVYESNKKGLLNNLLNTLVNKSFKVKLEGDLKYNFYGYKSTYPINQVHDIKL